VGKSGVEYATDQITVYPSCPYGCAYCFWRTKLWWSRLQRIKPKPLREAKKYLADSRRRIIVVSFTTDPYPPQEEKRGITRQVLWMLSHATHHKVLVLTKNPRLAFRDLVCFTRHGNMWIGTTVVTLEENRRLEPSAPPPSERLHWLRMFKTWSVPTWLSIEPIIPGVTPVRDIVKKTVAYVDMYVFGAMNYASQLGFPRVYPEQQLEETVEAMNLLREIGKPFIIKKNLRRFVLPLLR